MNGQRVFTIGHSFHFWVAPLLEEIAKSAGISDHHIAGVTYICGSTITQHWDVPDADNKAKAALIAGKVDVLTMSNIWLPDDGIKKFARLAFEHNPDIRITVQEFWLPNDTYDPSYPLKCGTGIEVNHDAATMADLRKQHELYFKDMDDMIRGVNKDLGKNAVLAVPVGQAVLALREKIIAGQAPGIKDQNQLFADDWGHPNMEIQLLAAYCHFAVIYRTSPIGLPVPPELLPGAPQPLSCNWVAPLNLSPDQAKALNLLLQQLAWDAVIHNPLSGVKASASSPSDLK